MEDQKPASVESYGEAKEVNMSRAERERREVGLSSDEVRELNTLKPKKDMTRTHLVKKVGNVLAASLIPARARI